MQNLLQDYLTKQSTSKWLHTNKNDYGNLSIEIFNKDVSSSNAISNNRQAFKKYS